jgi:hypothetical protein
MKGRLNCTICAASLVLVLTITPSIHFLRGEPSDATRAGPGLQRTPENMLKLDRKADLSQVTVENYAKALGKDKDRIFAFLRDQVAYQAYSGALRGPRGTLLAMSGNSLDRAMLLAALLEASGKHARFAQGTLSDEQARALVLTMWSTPTPKPATDDRKTADSQGASLVKELTGDLNLLQQASSNAKKETLAGAGESIEGRTAIARTHYWVQVKPDQEWLDLDPSFGDAKVGETLTKADATFTAVPDKLFHHVKVSAKLEEFADGKISQREILTSTMKASEISGALLVFCHRPEGWNGKDDLTSALSATGGELGKPVLMINEKFTAGKPFRWTPAASNASRPRGLGDMLRGEGTRHQSAIATAETLEFEFVDPAGKTDKVSRQVFDLLGKATRASGKLPSADEIAAHPARNEIENDALALFFTTGSIDRFLLPSAAEIRDNKNGAASDVATFLTQLNAAFAAGSDAVMAQFRREGGPDIVCYPDSPRLQIVKLSKSNNGGSLSFDLRRDHALVLAKNSQNAFLGRMFRGLLDGILERILIQRVGVKCIRDFDPTSAPMSAGLVISKAQAEGIVVRSLSEADLAAFPPEARIGAVEDLKDGNLVIGPVQPVMVASRPRFAWWRVNPLTGETIAVTDEGIYGAAVEKTEIERRLTIFASKALNVYYVIFTVAVGGETVTSAGTVPMAGGESVAEFLEFLFDNAVSVYDAGNGVMLKR